MINVLREKADEEDDDDGRGMKIKNSGPPRSLGREEVDICISRAKQRRSSALADERWCLGLRADEAGNDGQGGYDGSMPECR